MEPVPLQSHRYGVHVKPNENYRHSTAPPDHTTGPTSFCMSTRPRQRISTAVSPEYLSSIFGTHQPKFVKSYSSKDPYATKSGNASEQHQALCNLPNLMSMPTEMHLKIMEFLDHPNLLQFAATSKYFRSLVPERKVKESLLCFEECSLVTATLLTKKYLRPCYTCLKALQAFEHFPVFSQPGNLDLACEKASLRICATCIINTRHKLVFEFLAMPLHQDWAFDADSEEGERPRLFASRYTSDVLPVAKRFWWISCPKCNLVKRYFGEPNSRRRRYDDALLKGNMCAACYQPVWDEENRERRARKNARARQRYQEKREEARKRREAGPSREVKAEGLEMPPLPPWFPDVSFTGVPSFMPPVYPTLSNSGQANMSNSSFATLLNDFLFQDSSTHYSTFFDGLGDFTEWTPDLCLGLTAGANDYEQ